MRRVPLFSDGRPPSLAVDKTETKLLDANCSECALNDGKVVTPCMGPVGTVGGVLLLGEAPSRNEDRVGKPFVGDSGRFLQEQVARWWDGPVLVDNAVRCAPGRSKLSPKMVAQCRPYLSRILRDQFERVICLGAQAAFAVAGRTVSPYTTRKGYAFLRDGTPVFFLIHPTSALRNRFIRQWFDEDLRWALTTTPRTPDWSEDCRVVSTAAEARRAIDDISRQPWAMYDVETSGKMWSPTFEIIACAVAAKGHNHAWVWDLTAMSDELVRAPLLEWLADADAPKGGQNVKYDNLAIRSAYGVAVRGTVIDTRLVRKLLVPEASGALDKMVELVGMGGIKEEAAGEMRQIATTIRRNLIKSQTPLHPGLSPAAEQAIQSGEPIARYQYKLLSADSLVRYNARDALGTVRIAERLENELAALPNLRRTWDTIVVRAANALEHVEYWGIGVDRERLVRFHEHLEDRLDVAGAELAKFPGVNWNSTPQLRKLLFEDLSLPVTKTTATGAPSTAATALEPLRDKHSLVGSLLDYRFLNKMLGTYAAGMSQHVCLDGRIRPNIKLDGARSGRTSCVNPNLQNIPRADSPEGRMARDLFVASPGHVLLEFDYSQIELRVAAILSKDPKMISIFQEGVDYHLRTAELIAPVAWGIKPTEVTSAHRSQAKAINFSLLYGAGDKATARKLGCSVGQAARIREGILGTLRVFDRWCKTQVKEAKRSGYTWTYWNGERGRRRSLYRIADADGEQRSRAENGAVNTPIQGSANEYTLASLAECVEWIVEDKVPGVRLVLTVHDSIMFEVKEDMVEETCWVVKNIMTQWPAGGVPLVADGKMGTSWGSLRDIEL